MSEAAEAAYREAQARIAQALAEGSPTLDLRIPELNRIPDEIAELTALTFLDLGQTQVSSLGPISTLSALNNLDLGGTQVIDLAPISTLTALTHLNLYFTQVTDLAPVNAFTSLTNLNLSHMLIGDLAPISSLTSLTNLDLSYTSGPDAGRVDLTPISALSSLTTLSAGFSHVTDLSPLTSLEKLKSLDIHGITELSPDVPTHLEQLSHIAKLTNLESLDLAYLGVQDVSALATLTQLRSINMKTNSVLDYRPFRNIIIPEPGEGGPDDAFSIAFNQCFNSEVAEFDPVLMGTLANGQIGTRKTIEYLRALDDTDYDRRLAQWRAAQRDEATSDLETPTKISAKIEDDLRGPILVDAIADLKPVDGAFTATPVNGQAARPFDRPYADLLATLAFAANLLSNADAQNRLSLAVAGCFSNYRDQVALPDLNARLLQFLATRIGGVLSDENDLAALDGMDVASIRAFLVEHDNLIRSYYPDVLMPLSFTSDTPPQQLVNELPTLIAAVSTEITKATEAGLFLPTVSDVQEMLARAEEGARRGYMTASPADQAEAGRTLQQLAVAEVGYIWRIALRLREYGAESIEWAKSNPVAAARNAEFLVKMVTLARKLWALVAPYLHSPF